MKTQPAFVAAAAIALTLSAGSAGAASELELAQKKNCMTCHQVDKKILGPAYKEVAAKYAGQKDVVDKLTQKVLKGGVGTWGQIPMPPNAQLTEAEARQLVEWVLQQK